MQMRREPGSIDAGHFADMSGDVYSFESANLQAAALFEQAFPSRRHTGPDAARRRELLDEERLHRGSAERKVTACNCFAAKASSSRGRTSRITGLPPRLRAALPSCSNRMSPLCSGFANRRYTASAFASTVSKPRRVQLARRNCKRANTG